jgi:hypothetical protein
MNCSWNNKGGSVFGGHCPILIHTLYPYFLGLVFGAKYSENGDVKVCCPAEFGVDTLVRISPHDGKFPLWVPSDWRDIIHAEVVAVHGYCEVGYRVGDRIVFPTCSKSRYRCPALTNNVSPFADIRIPPCINLKHLRCPDWAENIYCEG